MSRAAPHAGHRAAWPVLVLSCISLIFPVVGAFIMPSRLADYQALLWLWALIPAFVLTHWRGWSGVATAIAAAMAVVSVTYAATTAIGRDIPDLLYAVLAAYVGIALGIGFLTARLSDRHGAASGGVLIERLTGLPSREHAEYHLAREVEAARVGRPLALVLFRLDNFRTFIETNGEAAANGVLRAVASILRQHTRHMNLSARYDADLFVCVLSGSGVEGALVFAERVQEQLRAARSMAALPSASVGIAVFQSEMNGGTDLIEAAMRGVEMARHDGGNRIRVHGPSAAEGTPGSAYRPSGSGNANAGDGRPRSPAMAGRSVFVHARDAELRADLTERLDALGVRVSEGDSSSDMIVPLRTEFDAVVLELSAEEPAVELVRELRARWPATRVIGIPPVHASSVPAGVLRIRVDGHYLPVDGKAVFDPPLRELFADRDRMRRSSLKTKQLSDEVTARRLEAQAAVKESEARYQSVVEHIRDAVFRLDMAGVITSLNAAWAPITGFGLEESIGEPLLDRIAQEDVDDVAAELGELARGDRPYIRREVRLTTRSGASRWVEMRARAVRGGGQITGAAGTLTDVSERHAAAEARQRRERQFRALIENSADIIVVVDPTGRITYASPAVERVLGFDPEERTGNGAFELIHPDDRDKARDCFTTTMEAPGSTASVEVRGLHRDGTWRDLAVTARNLVDVPGIDGLVINAHDVTEHRAAQQALHESEDMLLRSQKLDAIGRLAGGVAHDFNNLLTAIQGNAELILADLPEGDPARAGLREICDAAGRATSLTRQLLAFSRKQVLRPKVFDLNELIESMRVMITRLAGPLIDVVMDLHAEPVRVRADASQIEQVILNLTVNARDSMPTGGRLSFRTFHGTAGSDPDLEGAFVALEVRDTGHGIDAKTLPHIFDPFFTTKPGGKGAGLGLSTVYGIVKQSGGHVVADSVTDADVDGDTPSGTTFSIRLPLVTDEESEVSPATRTPPAQVARGRETIVLVEDEKSVRDLAERILLKNGYRVIQAANGREAIATIGRFPERIDMLVTDVVMPEMNGSELADRIAVMRPGVKVLFISGYTQDAIGNKGVLPDDIAFLAKPFAPDALLRKVREVLDG